MSAGRLTEIYNRYKNDVEFFLVYIREAHAIDSPSPTNFKAIEDPVTLAELPGRILSRSV